MSQQTIKIGQIASDPNGTQLRKKTDVAWIPRRVIRDPWHGLPGLRYAASGLHKSRNLVPLASDLVA